MRRDLPWHVVMLPTAVIVNALVNANAHIGALVRPEAVAIVSALLLLAILSAITRNVVLGGLLTTSLAVVALSRGPVVLLPAVLGILSPWQLVLLVLGLSAICGLAVSLAVRAARRDPGLLQLNRLVNVLTLVLLVLTVMRAAGMGVGFPSGGIGNPSRGDRAANMEGRPDIFVVLLDGYPRADVLRRNFGFDNQPFLTRLQGLGFDVASGSRANYAYTLHSLASIFDMRYLDDEELRRGPSAFSRLINHGAAIELLRQSGYEIATVPSAFEESRLTSADVVMDSGGISEFEYRLLDLTFGLDVLIWAAPDSLLEWQRQSVTGAVEQARLLAEHPTARPRFSFVHIGSPHEPILLKADGTLRRPVDWRSAYSETAATLGLSQNEFISAYVDQITVLNDLTLNLVSAIVEHRTRPTVVLVMSDHGFRDWSVPRHEIPNTDLRPRFDSLFASLTPGEPGMFPDDISNVDIFPLLFNGYFATSYPSRVYQAWLDDGGHFFKVEPGP
jgi:hypothetical protein